MIRRLQVFWISALPTGGPQPRITHVAGRFPDGSRWELSAEDAFAAMRNDRLGLFIIRNGDVVDLIARFSDGLYYLSTAGDERAAAQLLALPAFAPARQFPG